MLRKILGWMVLSLWGILWSQGPARGQAQLDGPVLTPPTEEIAPAPKAISPSYVLPPLVSPTMPDPVIDPVLEAGYPPPGFFTNLELIFLRPHLNSHLVGQVPVSPTQVDTVDLHTGGLLGTTVSPRLEVGYRLRQQRGEFTLGYRLEGLQRTSVPGDSSEGISQRDRLNLNLIDLTWGNRNFFALPPGWDVRFFVGVRLGTLYYDTLHEFGGPAINPAGLVDQHATSNFVGFGPLAGLDLSRQLFFPGLAANCRVTGSGLFGEIRQSFDETTTSGGSILAGSSATRYQVEIPTLTVQAGLSYVPPRWNNSRFLLGYFWEEFWQIGRLNSPTNPATAFNNGDLLNRGLFLRAEFNF